jgi:hypothetical protein
MKAVSYILLVQGIYWLVTGVWGLVDIVSFMKVTGPKTDVWLVKTVSVLIVVISLSLCPALEAGVIKCLLFCLQLQVASV